MEPCELRTARRDLGLSQAALAERLGVARETVNRWELGRWPVPRYIALAVAQIASEN